MKCPQCGGEGILRTGIAEASTTVCDFCDGAGTLRPKIEATPRTEELIDRDWWEKQPPEEIVDQLILVLRRAKESERQRDEAYERCEEIAQEAVHQYRQMVRNLYEAYQCFDGQVLDGLAKCMQEKYGSPKRQEELAYDAAIRTLKESENG